MKNPVSIARILGFAALLAGLPAPAQAPNEFSPVGVNLSDLAYWTAERVFVDVFKHAGRWLPQRSTSWEWDTGESLDLDADGWVRTLRPGQAAGTVTCLGTEGHYPGGRYVCLYDGDGDIQLGFDARTVRVQPGRIEFDVTPSNGGIYVKLVRTNPQNPVRNIRVILPGFEATYQQQPFHPQFLARSQYFKVLRFMNWGRANESKVRSWSQRTRPTSYSQGGDAGVCYELMIRLANELDADPWFSIPHLADDDYVRQLATLTRDTLEPGRKVHIEYSNEVWNGGFSQHHYAAQQGLALGLSTISGQAALRYHSQRSVEIFGIFENVFGGTQRLVRVLGAQHANPGVGIEVMDWRSAWQRADALAIAPYFGSDLGNPARQSEVARMTEIELFLAMVPGLVDSLDRARMNGNEARNRGLELIAYEGGQHLLGYGSAQNNSAITDLFLRVNRHPAMAGFYYALQDGWRRAGGRMFVTFNSLGAYSKFGSWGLCEWETSTPLKSPKYWGFLYFAANHPRWW